MSVISREKHVSFYKYELEIIQLEIEEYHSTEARVLREKGQLFLGLFQGIDQKRGNILIKFRKHKLPRLKRPYIAFTLPVEYSKPNEWGDKTYETIRNQDVFGSDVLPIYFYPDKEDDDFIIVGFTNIEVSFAERLDRDDLIIVAEGTPPFQYLKNLKEIVENPDLKEAVSNILDISIEATSWNPERVESESNIMELVVEHLKQEDEIIIQGPPGTGKTYLAAQLCDHFLTLDKSVLVTSMTNKALIELAEKEHLRPWMAKKRIWKTRLNLDEKREYPNIQQAKGASPLKGHLVLSTYYTMSKAAVQFIREPIFDVVILEEASQSFIATIAACKILARKLIIIGDPMQLQPIYRQPRPENIHPKMDKMINGLRTYAYNSGTRAIRLTETYRLTQRASSLTGLFYENSLVSQSKIATPIRFETKYKELFHEMGGTSFKFMDIEKEGKVPESAFNFILDLVKDIHEKNPGFEIAVLSPFARETIGRLQFKLYNAFNDVSWLTTETVDRIQGMTCDITIYLIPFGSSSFSFDLNRFNVATSRSRLCTLIVTDLYFEQRISATDLVQRYWRCIKER
jgi:DNA replication ATP-dependent helicase Dna2